MSTEHDEAVRWRVDAMRAQVAPGSVAVPLLVACQDAGSGPDTCVSCGGQLAGPAPVVGIGRCPACREAAQIVTAEWAQGSATAERGVQRGCGSDRTTLSATRCHGVE